MDNLSFSQFSRIPKYLSNYLDSIFPKGPSSIQIQTLLLLEDQYSGKRLSDKLVNQEMNLNQDTEDILNDDPISTTNFHNLINSTNINNTNNINYIYPLENYLNIQTSLLMESKSGTGKTLSFLLASLISTRFKPGNDILILVPTKELVWQLKIEAEKLLKPCIENKEAILIYNFDNKEQIQSNRIRIFISTPHKWINALDKKLIHKFENISVFVLDEVDSLFEDQHIQKVKRCWNRLLKSRTRHKFVRPRVLAFSATFEKWVINELLHSRIIIEDDTFFESVIPRFDRSVKGIREYYLMISQKNTRSETLIEKEKALVQLLLKINYNQVIIFCNRKSRCKALVNFLSLNNFPGISNLYGDTKDSIREETLKNFFEGKSQILVTTDIASRGLNLPTVDLIINLDIPHSSPIYMHRIGRTGRFGRIGASITLVSDSQESLFQYVRRLCSNEISLINENQAEIVNAFMSENKSENYDSFKQKLKDIKSECIQYIENSDKEPIQETNSTYYPKEYQFDFDLPVIEESETSFRIGHIQILLPSNLSTESKFQFEGVSEMDSIDHPFPFLKEYNLALTNHEHIQDERFDSIFSDCPKIFHEHSLQKKNN